MVSDMVPGRHVSAVFGTIAGFTLGIVFGTLMVLHSGRQSYHFTQSMSKENDTAAYIEHEDPSCTKFILFTTQRSGSDWLSDALSRQPEVRCEGELLWGFFRQPEAEVSANWMDEVDRSFDRVCKEARRRGKSIAGFKIMYNQVRGERHKVNGVDLPGEWFKDYLEKRNVRILHLVREAQILTMASWAVWMKERQEFNLSIEDQFHTKNPDVVAKTMNSSKLYFGKQNLTLLRYKESQVLEWSAFLRQSGLPYHSVRYEDLTSKNQDEFVHIMLQFLGIKDMVSYPKFESRLLLRHKARCEDRIAHFEDEVKPLIHGTMSERACAVLEYSNSAHSMSKADTHIEHGDPSCTKFIVFTLPRSGSDWLTDALSRQPEVWCVGEQLFFFSQKPEAEVSANWMDEVDRSFDRVCKEARSRGKSIAGFKIMYNQVRGERHKVNGVDLPGEWFKDYLEKRNVRILHLVREAQILTMASLAVWMKERQEFNLSIRDQFHTKNPDVVAKTMNSSKLYFGQQNLTLLRYKESQVLEWSIFLRRLGLPYHSVRYEDLTSKNQDEFVHMMLQFLGIKDTVSYPKFESQFQLRHKARCEDRIAHFEDEVKPLIHGTMSERACAVLEYSNLV